MPRSAIVTGSGVVVIGPVLPAGVHGIFAGQLGGGVVGMLVTMQLSVRQFAQRLQPARELGRQLCLSVGRHRQGQGNLRREELDQTDSQ